MSANILRHLFCGLLDIIPTRQNSSSDKHHKRQQYTDIYTGEESSILLPSSTQQEQFGLEPSRSSSLIRRYSKLRPHANSLLLRSHSTSLSNHHQQQQESHRPRAYTQPTKSLTRSDLVKSGNPRQRRVTPPTVLNDIEDVTSVQPFLPEPPIHGVDSNASSAINRSTTNNSTITNDSNFLHFVIDNTPNYSYGISSTV